MTSPLTKFWVHTVSLARYEGAGSVGDIHATPESLQAFVIPGERLYRTADGREKLASGTVFLPAGVNPPALQSEVTCAHPGLHGRVASVTVYDAGGLPLPECLEVLVD